MEEIKKFIKELTTIFKLKRQIKKLETDNQIKEEKIEDLQEHIKDISDSELLNIKTERLKVSRDHWLEIVHKLREENKKLRKELKDLENES